MPVRNKATELAAIDATWASTGMFRMPPVVKGEKSVEGKEGKSEQHKAAGLTLISILKDP